MKISTLKNFSRDAVRFSEIVTVFAKYGFAGWMKNHEPEFIKNILKSSTGESLSNLSPETRLRMAMTELGTTFIKLGQILSTRADLIGPKLAEELTQLQADTPADPPDVVRQTLEIELEKSVEDLFAEFDFNPLGSASIGQVHRAVLKNGQTVVVKVQHAGIEPKIAGDLEILKALAELAEQHDPDLRLYQPRATVAEFSRNLIHELDYRRERRNTERFQNNFADDNTVCIPRVYPEFSSQRVLTMEMLEGYSVSETERVKADGVDSQEFARRGATLYLEMVFRDRFFHADPHPGNIWVLKDGSIGLLDCGMTARLDGELSEELEGMLLASVDKDAERLTDHVLRVATTPQGLDRRSLQSDIDAYLSDYLGLSLSELDLSAALNGLTAILRDHHIILPAGLSMLIRVLVMLEGTSRLLDRNFSLAEIIQPYAAKLIQRRYSPEKLLRRVQRSHRDWSRFIDLLPRELGEVIQRAREGRFNIHLEHRNLDAVINRLIYGILSAALFLGGCMVLGQQIPPTIKGISMIGASICVFGLILGFRVLRAIKKSGNLFRN